MRLSACIIISAFLLPAVSIAQQRSVYDQAAWIIAAVPDNDTTTINQALKEGADIDFKRGGMNALHYAIHYKRPAMVKFLLSKGASPFIVNEDGKTPLELAEKSGNQEIILLIRNKTGMANTTAAAPVSDKNPAKKVVNGNPEQGADVITGKVAAPVSGQFNVGEDVLYSRDRGKSWKRGTIKGISTDPDLITDNQPLYLVEDQAKISQDYIDISYITTLERQESWTSFFVGDWDLHLPIAVTERVIDRDVYQFISGGDRLPPLRINANGTYSWVIDSKKVIKGKWKANSQAPGIILMAADRGGDWLMYNTSNAKNRKIYKADYIMLVSEAHYTAKHGFRIKKK